MKKKKPKKLKGRCAYGALHIINNGGAVQGSCYIFQRNSVSNMIDLYWGGIWEGQCETDDVFLSEYGDETFRECERIDDSIEGYLDGIYT